MFNKSLAITLGFIVLILAIFGFILSFVVGPFSEDNADVISFNPSVQYQLRCARCHGGRPGGYYKKAEVMAHPLLESPGPISQGNPEIIAAITANGLLPEMPAWKHKLAQKDIEALADYIAQKAAE